MYTIIVHLTIGVVVEVAPFDNKKWTNFYTIYFILYTIYYILYILYILGSHEEYKCILKT